MTGRRSHGRLSALNGVVHQGSDLMGKALWKLVENAARFPRRGGRVLCVHGAVSFHRARPCGPRWLLGRGAMRHVELDRRVLGLQSTGE